MVEDNARVFMKISANKTEQEIIDFLNGLQQATKDILAPILDVQYNTPTYKFKVDVKDLGNNEFYIVFKVYYSGTTNLPYIARKQRQDLAIDKVEKAIEDNISQISGTVLTTHLCYRDKPGVNK